MSIIKSLTRSRQLTTLIINAFKERKRDIERMCVFVSEREFYGQLRGSGLMHGQRESKRQREIEREKERERERMCVYACV